MNPDSSVTPSGVRFQPHTLNNYKRQNTGEKVLSNLDFFKKTKPCT